MDVDATARLRKITWFSDLPEEVLVALVKTTRKHDLHQGEILFSKGDVGDSLFVILDGQVKIVTKDEDGNEIALNKVGAGEIIGEMALFDHKPRSAGVVAIERTSTLELKRDDFMEILVGHPNLALAIIRNLSKRLRHNTSYIEEITKLSRRVAIGDYSLISESQIEQTPVEEDDEQDKVDQLMAEFVAMVRSIREREDELKKQVQKLTLQIDEGKRKQEFEEIVSADFYAPLKEQAKKIRAQRKDKR